MEEVGEVEEVKDPSSVSMNSSLASVPESLSIVSLLLALEAPLVSQMRR